MQSRICRNILGIKNNLRKGQRNSIANGVLYWKGGDLDDELEALGIQPRMKIDLEQELPDPFFEQKYILHFDARDVPPHGLPRRRE